MPWSDVENRVLDNHVSDSRDRVLLAGTGRGGLQANPVNALSDNTRGRQWEPHTNKRQRMGSGSV
jgi:hypothetical protein